MKTALLGTRVDATSYAATTAQVIGWSRGSQSRYVCVANVHVIMEAHDSAQYQGVINNADLVTPDGMPLVWMLRLKGCSIRERVYGPTLMRHLVAAAARSSIAVGLYGSTPEVLESLCNRLKEMLPDLKLGYSFSPPFRELTADEDELVCRQINASGIRLLFVGLGCPKQEYWMAAHRDRIQAVMVGVGAAFDFLGGSMPQAPHWIQDMGMEWAFRLAKEPRRLWRRYLINNPRFAALAAGELFRTLGR